MSIIQVADVSVNISSVTGLSRGAISNIQCLNKVSAQFLGKYSTIYNVLVCIPNSHEATFNTNIN
jgi:hypothetical protein